MNVYLDIDGTLLHKDGTPAEGLHDFLEWVTQEADCYWLTTHCRDGSLEHLHSYLKRSLEPETFELIKLIKPTVWDVLKTEAIDFGYDFRWLDDQPMASELLVLQKYNVANCLIHIDLNTKSLMKYKDLIIS